MRFVLLVLTGLFLVAAAVFAQSASGTITGVVTDPAGAVIAGAAVQGKNVETGVVYPGVTTATGRYTLLQVPPGNYEVTVSVQGFKKYVRQALTVQAAQTLPVDITLEVGAVTESITVNAEATLLKTETCDVAHNITL
jgi:hypothetical protein